MSWGEIYAVNLITVNDGKMPLAIRERVAGIRVAMFLLL